LFVVWRNGKGSSKGNEIMTDNNPGGYMGKVLRVDLSREQITTEEVEAGVLRKYLGGTGLGAKYLYDEVPSHVGWSDPENRMMWMAGPLNGTRVSGSGTFSVVTKGALTNLAASSQANGFFGAFIKLSGFDGIVTQGTGKRWTYLYIHDNQAELRDASHLLGKDTWETEEAIKAELGVPCSVYGIGPAGENLVRFACIAGDCGHVAAHSGIGAVMGSKKLKAIVAARGKLRVPTRDPERLAEIAKPLFESAKNSSFGITLNQGSTAMSIPGHIKGGTLPTKNYTTNVSAGYEKLKGDLLRTYFKLSRAFPCWACGMKHIHKMEILEGPYKGFVGEEPEYEGIAGMSSQIGQQDPAATLMLVNLVDRLGMDVNESGYVIGWIMECYEKGLLSKDQLDGLEMNWGDVEATAAMLRKIAHREGVGNLLAEGVKRAAERIGGEALNCAVYTLKGANPRGHDHRAQWAELVDTCLSNTGTIEATGGDVRAAQDLSVAPVKDRFNPEEISTMNAKINGRRVFEDSLCVCRFCLQAFQEEVDALNAVTGWDYTVDEAMETGRRIVNQLRVFNFKHGLTKELEAPSSRYGSAPTDGPVKGISIMPHWDFIRRNYYQQMGWDPETGKPLPDTLERLGLENCIKDIW
jgi:aldehyde:ferredoxin oxidoreductase